MYGEIVVHAIASDRGNNPRGLSVVIPLNAASSNLRTAGEVNITENDELLACGRIWPIMRLCCSKLCDRIARH